MPVRNVAMAIVGGDFRCTSLNEHRHRQYITSAYKFNSNFATISPSEAQLHIYRVFHQQWLGNALPTEEWGWRTGKGNLVPITTLKAPALDKLPKLISCKYPKGCRGNCGCRKIELFCTRLCDCDGHCSNQVIIFDEDDGKDDLLESPLSSDNFEEVEVDPPPYESQPYHKHPKLSPLDTPGPSGS
ncbi:hypothetical protein JTB14_000866 [Gonioctena quinquepunctata]|nr:hypothetical protein JTB14_000866 [Gonioctena quinquepunctata]